MSPKNTGLPSETTITALHAIDRRIDTLEDRHKAELRLVAIERDVASNAQRANDFRESDAKIKEKEEKALVLQAIEYERRLDALNHAHEEAREVQKSQVRTDTFDRFESEVRAWNAAIEKRLNVQEGKDFGKAATWAASASVVALLLSLWNLLGRPHP